MAGCCPSADSIAQIGRCINHFQPRLDGRDGVRSRYVDPRRSARLPRSGTRPTCTAPLREAATPPSVHVRPRSGCVHDDRYPRQHLARVLARGFGDLLAAEHAREFLDARAPLQLRRFATPGRPSVALSLATAKCWSPRAATCGRWVTHSTWRLCPSCFSRRPTVSATAPPMPASTSSKISVGTGVAVAAMTAIASEMRASSPPDATRGQRLRPRRPAWRGDQELRLLVARGCRTCLPASCTSKRPPAMDRSCIARVTSVAIWRAAAARAFDSACAAAVVALARRGLARAQRVEIACG